MKIITKKIPARVSAVYQCKKCKTKYRSAKRASECEALPVEDLICKIGDSIILVGWMQCMKRLKGYKKHKINVNVEKITGPIVPDSETKRYAYGKIDGKHVFEYDVGWYCKKCQHSHGYRAYSFELKKIKPL